MLKHCDRCKNSMLKEEVILATEAKEKYISAYHCIYCGRIEYGTVDPLPGPRLEYTPYA